MARQRTTPNAPRPASDAPPGGLFSEVYISKGQSAADSTTARERLYAYFSGIAKYCQPEIAEAFHKAKGIRIRVVGVTEAHYLFDEFFRTARLIDLLDCITIIAWVLKYKATEISQKQWIEAVGQIFRQENLHYRVDDLGGVHYSPDEAFEHDRISAVAAIQGQRYRAVATEFELAHKALDETPPNGKGAVKAVFESIETLFRLMADDSKCQRLGSTEIDTFLVPIVIERCDKDEPAKNSALLLVKSFKQWVASAHFQRHGQPVEDPYQPPLELAIALVSQGTGFLRWLAEIDQARQRKA